jgi:hypothetical protein
MTFFVSGIWVAETDLEAIVGTKTGEQLRFMDLVHDPAADAGGIVENQEGGNPSDVVEDVHEALADTLCSLATEYLAETVIAEREGNRHGA